MVLQLNYTCKEETRAVHIHCYSHYLNLAEVGAINLKLMRSELDIVHKTSKLVYYSPSRDGLFQALKVRLDQIIQEDVFYADKVECASQFIS